MSLKVLTFCALLAFSEALKIRVDVSLIKTWPSRSQRSHIFSKDYGYARVEKKKEEGQDFSKIPGVAGHDYPIYHEFPHTSFDCGR